MIWKKRRDWALDDRSAEIFIGIMLAMQIVFLMGIMLLL